MSYFMFKDDTLMFCKYTEAPNCVKSFNTSNIIATRFGILIVLNEAGRVIEDWLDCGDSGVVISDTSIARGVLIDKEYMFRQIIMSRAASESGTLNYSANPYKIKHIDNYVYSTSNLDHEKMQYALDAGHTLEETRLAMLKFNLDFRHFHVKKIQPLFDIIEKDKNMITFRNPNIKVEAINKLS